MKQGYARGKTCIRLRLANRNSIRDGIFFDGQHFKLKERRRAFCLYQVLMNLFNPEGSFGTGREVIPFLVHRPVVLRARFR